MRSLILSLPALLVAALILAACAMDDREKTITIGAAVSETGRYAQEGGHVKEGYVLWKDWVNDEYGGITVGDEVYTVELVTYDDASDPETNAALIEQLIDEDQVDFLLGPYSSTLTQSAIEVAEERDTIMVEGAGSSEKLFEPSYGNLFAVLAPAGQYTHSALEALTDMGAQSVVIAHSDAIFPASVAAGAEEWAAAHGLETLAVHEYPEDISDATDILSRFKPLNPDVFIGAGYFNDALLFVRAARQIDFNPKAMILTVGPTDPALIRELGADANYLIGPTQWEASMSYRGDYFGSASDYAEMYVEKWGELPTYQAASATAAALALQLAIEDAESTDMDAVRSALRELDVTTFYGRISFESDGSNRVKPAGAIQIQNGATRVIAPPDAAIAQLIYPMPPWSER